MLLQIPAVFDQDKLNNISKILITNAFIDGRQSAGQAAKAVKHNEEMQSNPQQTEYLDRLIMTTLAANRTFRDAVLPHQVSQPVFARYSTTMRYGNHIDDPIMGGANGRFRSDVAITIFLNAPTAYEGGELIINTTFGERQVKLAAGDVITYPASSIHRVNEVSSGERLVAVCWVQSLVRDATKRELLYELCLARHELMNNHPDSKTTQQVDHSYVNLVRMWSDV
ncbi:MAG: Fe2+-dependent dioxygenase [Gammaproteobacteria bacterium]|nr:Fe2+-dependent dioxygenase [Gammaproteobacteria bacterium]